MWYAVILVSIFPAVRSIDVDLSKCTERELLYGNSQTVDRGMFVDSVIVLKGKKNVTIGSLVTNYDKKTLSVNVIETRPREDYKNLTYLYVTVLDDTGRRIFERTVKGSLTDLSNDAVPIRDGYIIQIYHAEVNTRLVSDENIIDSTNSTNRWLVTRYGLKNLRLHNIPIKDFVAKIDKYAQNLQINSETFFNSIKQQQLLSAILSLPQPYSNELLHKYNTIFPYCIVQSLLLFKSNIDSQVGYIELSFGRQINNLNLIGGEVLIKSGVDIISQNGIFENNGPIYLEGVPFGVYSLEFHGRVFDEYVINPQFIAVNEENPKIAVDLERIHHSILMDQSIEFYGAAKKMIGILRAMYSEGSIVVTLIDRDAHSYFSNNAYITIEVTNKNGVQKYNRKVLGSEDKLFNDVLPMEEGDVIKVLHIEGTRDRLWSNDVPFVKSDYYSNSWKVTQYGLQHNEKQNDPLDKLVKVIDSKAQEIVSDPFRNGLSFFISEEKKQLLAAIRFLPETLRKTYLKKHHNLFRGSGGTSPTDVDATKTFTLTIAPDYPEELAGKVVRVENEKFVFQQTARGDEVSFDRLPYGHYSVQIPEV